MSDYTENDEIDTDDDAQDEAPKPKRNWRRELEAEAEAGKQAKAEAAAAKRELALIRAGIDLSTPQGKLFAKAYDGEPTADAIKAAAQEYGVLDTDTPSVPADELAAHDRVANAASGATTPNDGDIASQELAKAETAEEVLAALRKHVGDDALDNSGFSGWGWQKSPEMGYMPLNK